VRLRAGEIVRAQPHLARRPLPPVPEQPRGDLVTRLEVLVAASADLAVAHVVTPALQ
jgi:hypothetical protein